MDQFIKEHNLSQAKIDNPISSSLSPRPRFKPRSSLAIKNNGRPIQMGNKMANEELIHLQPSQLPLEQEIQDQSSSGDLLINEINNEQLINTETETHPTPIIISRSENIQPHNEVNTNRITAVNRSSLKDDLKDADPGSIHYVKVYIRNRKAMQIRGSKRSKYI